MMKRHLKVPKCTVGLINLQIRSLIFIFFHKKAKKEININIVIQFYLSQYKKQKLHKIYYFPQDVASVLPADSIQTLIDQRF